VRSQIDDIARKKVVPRNLAVLATVVGLIEEGKLDPKDVAEIIRGEKCIKDYGLVSTFAECDDIT